MVDDETRDKLIAQAIGSAEFKQRLGSEMSSRIYEERLKLRTYPICTKCGMPLVGILDPLFHTDEQCCVYLVMES
jgi:hypothetical protein